MKILATSVGGLSTTGRSIPCPRAAWTCTINRLIEVLLLYLVRTLGPLVDVGVGGFIFRLEPHVCLVCRVIPGYCWLKWTPTHWGRLPREFITPTTRCRTPGVSPFLQPRPPLSLSCYAGPIPGPQMLGEARSWKAISDWATQAPQKSNIFFIMILSSYK